MMYKVYNFKFPDSLLQDIIPEYYKGLYTTFFNEKLDCNEYYQNVIDTILKDMGLHHRSRCTCYSWAQVYDEKTGHGLHDHYNPCTLFSWVHFINPLDTECFHFLDSDDNKLYPPQKKDDLIIFPSWAPHEIDYSPVKGRAVIAGNVFVEEIESSIGISRYNVESKYKQVWEVTNPKE